MVMEVSSTCVPRLHIQGYMQLCGHASQLQIVTNLGWQVYQLPFCSSNCSWYHGINI